MVAATSEYGDIRLLCRQHELARPSREFPLSALSVAYGAGLRVFEVANLKVSAADSECMTLRVEQGRGSGIAM